MKYLIKVESPEQINILEKYGFKNGFFASGYYWKKLNAKARKLDFPLPKQSPLMLVYNLGIRDFDVAYFYDINGPVAFNGIPTLEQIDGLSRDLTMLLPSAQLISYYDGERFTIPVLRLWQNGKIISESENAGTETYTSDYWKKDEEEYKRRAKRDFGGLFELGMRSIPK